ncbi:3'-5' exonuclease, partial [Lacticaseibacillus paracasei]
QRQEQADRLTTRLAAKFAIEEAPLVQAANDRAAKSIQLDAATMATLASDQAPLRSQKDVVDRLARGDYIVIDTEFVADRNQLDLTEISLLRVRHHQVDGAFDIFTQLP